MIQASLNSKWVIDRAHMIDKGPDANNRCTRAMLKLQCVTSRLVGLLIIDGNKVALCEPYHRFCG